MRQVYYRKRRYLVYAIATIFLLTMPFITINDNHIFLLSFTKGEFHLLGTRFNMQELYLLPFLSILLFVGIFFLTTLGGRIWCGWACPQTIFRVIYRDFLQTKVFGLRQKISNKQKPLVLDTFGKKVKASLAFVIILFLCLVAAASLMFFFTAPEDFFVAIQNPSEHKVLMVFWLGFGLFFAIDIAFIQENFCIYICPYSRVQSVLYDNDTIMAIYNQNRGGVIYNKGDKITQKLKFTNPNAECVQCEHCVKVCPTHIDIRKGMQLECINCLECVDACTSVMAKYNKPSLVGWSSPAAVETNSKVRYMRLKTICYVGILLATCIALLIMGGKKEGMLLNVNSTSEIYKIKTQGVENTYRVLFHNTDSKEHEYFLSIENPSADSQIASNLEIITPKKPIRIRAGQKVTQIVTIRAKGLEASESGDVNYPFILKSYALDDESIFAERKANFIYPSKGVIQEYERRK
ncbi:cytochrome c oxidase accessory protein CcoG [Helicobacter himalayensis]|uniref:cytochrome c oxidase accessory protein CcoG n=1 Tax=Helicobacter himalayensis TaxID=1591088 RepID=UPI00082A4FF6|nr:cytochrome c oxidase accessory protein CcoG [Helicobacter himalayensis]